MHPRTTDHIGLYRPYHHVAFKQPTIRSLGPAQRASLLGPLIATPIITEFKHKCQALNPGSRDQPEYTIKK